MLPFCSVQLASYIDHTLLRPDASADDIAKLAREAIEYSFAGVCVNSCHIKLVSSLLSGTPVLPVSVVGFPLGAMSSDSKAFEAKTAMVDGAKEIDMVINLGALKSGDHTFVRNDIRAVVRAARHAMIKVIIETSLLNEDQKRVACALSVEAGAHFVKTSSGFNGGGATVADIHLMRAVVGPDVGVKASGGVRDAAFAEELIRAGATRLGTSSGIALVSGKSISGGY